MKKNFAHGKNLIRADIFNYFINNIFFVSIKFPSEYIE